MEIDRAAIFSPDRVYRYTLERTWDESLPTVVFVLLNPSTADETVDDPTNVRGMNFARDWECGQCVFVNLFAWRTPSPKVMKKADCPIGPDNDKWIKHWADRADILVAAWGTHGAHRNRNRAVLRLLDGYPLQCFEKTKGGHPKHPLYLKGDSVLESYR